MTEKGRFSHVSTSLLPIEDIGTLLKYKHGFTDIKSLGVETYDQLALAIDGDRHTIENALSLGGRPAADYMTLEKGEIMKIFSAEVADLRDELYQVKAELSRKGLVTNYDDYAGFHEAFRENDIIYVDGPVGKIEDKVGSYSSIVVDEAAYLAFEENDWLVVEYLAEDKEPVITRVVKKENGNTLHVKPNIPTQATSETAKLRKSLGKYYAGSFAYVKNTSVMMGDARYSTLDDDTYTLPRPLNNASKGIAYTFKINDFMFEDKNEGFFCELNLKASRHGSPDPLVAYLIYEKDIPRFKGTRDREFYDSLCLGISKAASLADYPEGKKETLRFDFVKDDGTYPIVQNMRMCVIIMGVEDTHEDGTIHSASINTNNYYQITYVHNREGMDLQVNNTLFEYDQLNNGTNQSLVTNDGINSVDLYYSYMLRPILDEVIQPYKVGLYTKKFKTNAPVRASRARVTMRINREGLFKTAESGTFDWISLLEDRGDGALQYNMTQLDGIGARLGDQVVVGTSFAEYDSQMPAAVMTSKRILAEEGEPVYRVGHHLYLRAKQVEVVESEGKYAVEVVRSIQKELKLVGIIEDRLKRKEKISDRLIFECDLLGEEDLAQYNHFELQVVWQTSYNDFYSKNVYPAELHGAIQDLTLSLERRH